MEYFIRFVAKRYHKNRFFSPFYAYLFRYLLVFISGQTLIKELRSQLKEVISFSPLQSIAIITQIQTLLEKVITSKKNAKIEVEIATTRAKLVTLLIKQQNYLSLDVIMLLQNLQIFISDEPYTNLSSKKDKNSLKNISKHDVSFVDIEKNIAHMINLRKSFPIINIEIRNELIELINNFIESFLEHCVNNKSLNSIKNIFIENENSKLINISQNFILPKSVQASQRLASMWEFTNQKSLAEANFIAPELQEARNSFLQILEKSKQLPLKQKKHFLQIERNKHFLRFPFLVNYQQKIDNPKLLTPHSILELLAIAPYTYFALQNLAKHEGISLESLFVSQPTHRRITLSPPCDECSHENKSLFLGECSINKPNSRSLLSESSINVWLSSWQNPWDATITLGHELVHLYQLEELCMEEQKSLGKDDIARTSFINFEHNFLTNPMQTELFLKADRYLGRTSFLGFDFVKTMAPNEPWIKKLSKCANKSASAWNKKLYRESNWYGFASEVPTSIKVQASREVLAALENAKNIIFAKELGLNISVSALDVLLPAANAVYKKLVRQKLEEFISSTNLDFTCLQLIANAQLHGVNFYSSHDSFDALLLKAPFGALGVSGISCQTQQ